MKRKLGVPEFSTVKISVIHQEALQPPKFLRIFHILGGLEKVVPLIKKKSEMADQDDDDGDESTEEIVPGADAEDRQLLEATVSKEPAAKMPKLSRTELYKLPTSEELHQLKETENLFQSSLFRMQITELLSEVTLTRKKRKCMDAYLDLLQDAIMNLPHGTQHDLSDAKGLKLRPIKPPQHFHSEKAAVKFQFRAPKSVHVVGSYKLGTCIKPEVHVDVALEIPKECLQSKDFLNQRYLHKRALYLSCVARHLLKSPLVKSVQFTHHHGNRSQPIIVLTPAVQHGKKYTIHIHSCAEPGVLKLNRFSPTKNNIRTQWYFQEKAAQDGEKSQPPTPHYNSVVLSDLTCLQQLHSAQQLLDDSQGLKDGIALLKVWLHQRQLDVGSGAFTAFIMTMYVAYLVTKRKLNRQMSSYQVFRNTLIQLGESDWMAEGISLAKEDPTDEHRPTLQDFHSVFDVVFVDSTGFLNLCAHMHSATFQRIKHEAKLGTRFLHSTHFNGFQMLFIKPVNFLHQFDQLFHVTNLQNLKQSVEKLSADSDLLDHCGDYLAACLPHLLQLLHRAIGRRVHLVALQPKPVQKKDNAEKMAALCAMYACTLGIPELQWLVTEEPPEVGSDQTLTVGLLLNRDCSHSVIDKGPAADGSEAQEFRDFWKDKSELRRFHDGTICEAVVWPCRNIAEKRMVMAKIIKHVLNSHAMIPRNTVTFISHQVEPLLKLARPPRKAHGDYNYGTGEEQYQVALQTYDDLCKHLRGLKDLPLNIHTIQGVSPLFRYSEVFPAMPATFEHNGDIQDKRAIPSARKSVSPWMPSLHLLCLLEGSGKWPEDKAAVRRIKAAFHIKLAQSLQKAYSLPCIVHPTHVDVLKNGYVFCVEVGYKHEITLLKMVSTPEGMCKMEDTDEALLLERHLVNVPKLTSLLHGIQQKFNSFSGAVRLAKRWLSSQLILDHHMPEEGVELLVAHCYLHPAPYTSPSIPQTGFLRFLNLLSTHDWQGSPLIVNFNDELKKEHFTEIESHMTKARAELPLMYIATPEDRLQSHWTKQCPTTQILHRVILLAKESLSILEGQLACAAIDTDFRQIFRPPLEVYDVLIHLRSSQLSRHYQAVDVTKEISVPVYREKQVVTRLPVTDFDPVKIYLRELREAFGDLALFFHDTYGGSLIAVLWKPQAFQPQQFKVSHVNCRMLEVVASGRDVQLVPNTDAVLQDFKIMGEGLIDSLQVVKKHV